MIGGFSLIMAVEPTQDGDLQLATAPDPGHFTDPAPTSHKAGPL